MANKPFSQIISQTNQPAQTSTNESPGSTPPILEPNARYEYPPYITRFTGAFWVRNIINEIDSNRLYFTGNGTGIIVFDHKTKGTLTIPFADSSERFTREHTVNEMVLNEETQELYVATRVGLVIINITTQEYTRYYLSTNHLHNYDMNNITVFIEFDQKKQRLLIGTATEGLRIFNLTNRSFVPWEVMPEELQEGFVGYLAFNNKTNELYYKTDAVYALNLTDLTIEKVLEVITADSLTLDEASQQLIIACNGIKIVNCTDKTLLGSYFEANGWVNIIEQLVFEPTLGGILCWTKLDEGVIGYNMTSEEEFTIRRENGLMTNDIASMIFYTNGTRTMLAIGNRASINFYDLQTKKVESTIVFDFELPEVYANYVSLNQYDSQILIGMNDYLSVYDITTETVSTYYDYIHGISGHVKDVIIDSEHNRWLVIATGALVIFDPENETAIKKYSTNEGILEGGIMSMCYDVTTQTVFLGTYSGLCSVNLGTDEVRTDYGFTTICHDLIYDEAEQRVFIAADKVYLLEIATMTIQPLQIDEQTIQAYELLYYPEKDMLISAGVNSLNIIDMQKLTFNKQFTVENSPLFDLYIDAIAFDHTREILFIASLGVFIYDLKHEFWININEAGLVEEELYVTYIKDVCYYQDTLYLAQPYGGFFVINIIDRDQDGLFDCCEEWLFGTNVLLNDTDADTYNDGVELWAGTDPLDPKSYPQEPIADWWTNWENVFLLTSLSLAAGTVMVISLLRRKN